MRAPRIVILVFFLVACFFILVRSFTSSSPSQKVSRNSAGPKPGKSSVWGFMYYNAPFSLFPPNAAISLTDDNSTSFAARPAAFGPKLVPNGLSGQLWVGSGFAEDTLDIDGELGCSDIPGRTRSTAKNPLKVSPSRKLRARPKSSHTKRGSDIFADADKSDHADHDAHAAKISVDDGTDDYLHNPWHDPALSSSHADIQSMQEAAEIEGKVVLLMRGGCGFLEKVMWAQRRGAIAVIVGDNQKGGPLIQMFAHGDEVENVTIPSVFTARTTAQLLSSLTQPGSFIEEILDDNGDSVLKIQQGAAGGKTKKTSDSDKAKSPTSSSKKSSSSSKDKRSVKDDRSSKRQQARPAWYIRAFTWGSSPRAADGKSRPPSSGRLDWIMVEEWDEENDKMLMDSMGKNKKQAKTSSEPAKDDFVIGVHDWRDPDLVDKSGSATARSKTSDKDKSRQKTDTSVKGGGKYPESNGPKGGSITPGSGEYSSSSTAAKVVADEPETETSGSGRGLMSKLFGDHDDDEGEDFEASDDDENDANPAPIPDEPSGGPHEGLWVTITPTSSASPFFDTLLVLVISPLITLTIVYALLILRARIRRRRWRAPKSVVDRLPVRTYHTVATTPSATSRLPSPSSASPTTPLLQRQDTQPSQPASRPRPRSRTTTGVPETDNFLAATPAVPTPRSTSRSGGHREHEKGAGGFSAEWRKYMGRQVECVVCLEEYVDGVSKVMSLPCGHEFHADCM
jgi:hypothetical protein